MSAPTFARPHPLWWLLIVGGLGLVALLVHCDAAYQWWCEHVTELFTRPVLWGIWVGAVVAHVLEARHAHKLAVRHGLHEEATAWTLQTLMLGYPSLHLLKQACANQGESA